MNITRLLLSSVAGFIAYFVYGGVVTGILLKKDFMPYAGVYRPAEQIVKLFPFGMLTTLIAVIILTIIYAQSSHANAGWAAGARFGALVGAFMVFAHVVHNYVNFNIGAKLAIEIGIAELLQWTIVGAIVGGIYRSVAPS